MKVHVYDDDPRQFSDPAYLDTHGPFADIAININRELKNLGHLSDPDEADFVGFSTGLDVGYRYKNKETFLIHVWETSNTLPFHFLQAGKDRRIFGLSDQITNLWKKYGYPVKTLYPGCDTEFWHQTKPKNEVFTFLHVNSSNVRSGLDLTLQAFKLAFCGNKNVQLIIKDTNNAPRLRAKIQELVDEGCNITYVSKYMTRQEIRDMYSSSHACLNLIRITSFGLPLLECSACNCLCVTGNVPPTNEIIKPTFGVWVPCMGEREFQDIIPSLVNDWGLSNWFPNLPYPEPPRMFDFDAGIYAKQLFDIYENWNYYDAIDTRTPVIDNWSWKRTAQTLIDYLT